jgi:hypothetical protein
MMLPEHPNSSLPDDLPLGIVIRGAWGRANLRVIEASPAGRCAIQTPAGPTWMAARLTADDVELRVFRAPQQLVETVAAFCRARDVRVASGKVHFMGGFELAGGVFVFVLDPYAPAFAASGPGAKFLTVDSGWPDLPMGWQQAISRMLDGGIPNFEVDPAVEGASHALH